MVNDVPDHKAGTFLGENRGIIRVPNLGSLEINQRRNRLSIDSTSSSLHQLMGPWVISWPHDPYSWVNYNNAPSITKLDFLEKHLRSYFLNQMYLAIYVRMNHFQTSIVA